MVAGFSINAPIVIVVFIDPNRLNVTYFRLYTLKFPSG